MSELRVEPGSYSPKIKFSAPASFHETHKKLLMADSLRKQGQLEQARALGEELVADHQDYFGALHLLGLIYAEQKNYSSALNYLVRAAMLNPRSLKCLTALSDVYLLLGAKEMAAQTLEQAREIDPRDAGVMFTLGRIYSAEREYELAQNAYREALRINPDLVAAAVGLGTSCERLGEHAEAARIFEDLIRSGTRSLGLLSALNQLPQSVVSLDVLNELDQTAPRSSDDKGQFETTAAFIRAACLDKAGQYEDAWRQLVPANRALFDPKAADRVTEAQQASLAWLAHSRKRFPDDKNAQEGPISLFILGASRSGKTLLEKLLATVEGVKCGYENPIVEYAVRRTFQLAGFLNATNMALLPPHLYRRCCEIYRDELQRRVGAAKVFTNTHPGHIYVAGHIALILPNVRFMFIKRDPDDTALRIFMRKYKQGNKYAYHLGAIRDHISWYHKMMDLIAEWQPGRVRIIHYENMVGDPAGALAQAVELCGISEHQRPLPDIGDDRACAEPYRKLMATELST